MRSRLSRQYFPPDICKVLPLPSRKNKTCLAVEDTKLEEVASTKIREAKPPLLDEPVLGLLPLGKLAEITLERLVPIRLPIGVFLMFLVIALSDRLS